jgi:hypothetical protein
VLTLVIFIVRDVYPTVFDQRATGRYGEMFAALHRRGLDRIEVRDNGVLNAQGDVAYAPQLQFYAVLWRERGVRIVRRPADAAIAPGVVTASCDVTLEPRLARLAPDLAHIPGCIAVVPGVNPR